MMKLWNDFGVRALMGVMVVGGAFLVTGLGLWKGQLTFTQVFPTISGWVGIVIGAYFVAAATRSSGSGTPPTTP